MTAAADTTVKAAGAAAVNGGAPPPLPLPVFPVDITAEWLSKVLARNVKSIVHSRSNFGTASKIFINVTYADDNHSGNKALPTQLCVKGGFDLELMRENSWIVMIYQRECDFYNLVAPKLSDSMELPRTLWAGYNATQGIMIMEDLAAQGCTFGSTLETWSVSCVRAGVEQLAALHAKTWQLQAKDYPWLTSDYDQVILTHMKTYGETMKEPERADIHDKFKDQDRITAALKKHYALRNPRFTCLLHGDAHTGNTFLVNGAPRFLDWQMIHIGSAFHDVSYFIGATLTIEDRRAHEWDIVNHYLRSLEKFGGPPLSVDDEEVVLEYKKSLLTGIAWFFCPFSMQAPKYVYPMAVRYNAALEDHKVLELVEGLPEPQ